MAIMSVAAVVEDIARLQWMAKPVYVSRGLLCSSNKQQSITSTNTLGIN